jgi:putative Mg2+ transporter-C (MgtC) family protein
MQIALGWQEIALRLLLTVVAGGLIGFNRAEHGRPAGLRTILLVCLAASVAMIQTNVLLGTAGRPGNSFVMLDAMRLPLGILSGMGFIGGGVILKRGDMVVGVTTAATLWFVTVLGLCFGGGQTVLGSVVLVIGLIVLWGLKWLELQLPHDRHGTLVLTVGADGPTEHDLRTSLLTSGLDIVSLGVSYHTGRNSRVLRCELRWRARGSGAQQPPVIDELARRPGVAHLQWRPQGMPL